MAAAGSVQPQGGIWRSYFAAGDGQQEATAWNSGLERFSCEHAAALNAACAHVMDMDDVHNASITHLGAVTIPAALAVGQKLHRSGREVLAAIAAGYEIGARVGEAINPGSYHYWHTTGAVSYTHLDVYKRQGIGTTTCRTQASYDFLHPSQNIGAYILFQRAHGSS